MKAAHLNQSDSCHMKLIDEQGEDLGGSNNFAGSIIDVNKKLASEPIPQTPGATAPEGMLVARKARKPKLFTDSVWGEVSAVCGHSGRKTVVIAHLNSGAAKLLKIKKGDIVVTCASDSAIKNGTTSAAELQKIASLGATLYNVDNLHAKVIITASQLMVGSANASTNSQRGLVEACLSTTDQTAIAKAEIWARSLLGEELSPEQLNRKAKMKVAKRIFTGVRARADAGVPTHAPLWLGYTSSFNVDETLLAIGEAQAEQLTKSIDTSRFETDTRY